MATARVGGGGLRRGAACEAGRQAFGQRAAGAAQFGGAFVAGVFGQGFKPAQRQPGKWMEIQRKHRQALGQSPGRVVALHVGQFVGQQGALLHRRQVFNPSGQKQATARQQHRAGEPVHQAQLRQAQQDRAQQQRFLSLQQLQQQALQLPLKLQPAQVEATAPEASLQNWRETLSYHWHSTWRGLLNPRSAMPEDYFDLSTEQQLMLRIALQQQLQLAQLAVMQQQPQIYQSALRQCADQLQRYFNADDSQVQQVSSALALLAAVDVTPPQVSALTSPAQLQQYLQQLAGDNL